MTRYDKLGPSASLGPFFHALPPPPLRVLDLGAAGGVVAKSLARRGHHVLAVEPVPAFRRRAAERDLRVLDDRLPHLLKLGARRFDLVLALGLWHHLTPAERRLAWRRLAQLTVRGGRFCLSLRLGQAPPGRPGFAIHRDHETANARRAGFRLRHSEHRPSVQAANRAAGVHWLWQAYRFAA